MEFTSANIGEMANYYDNEGMTHAEAATAYIANNRDQIDLFMK
jgi:ABC-type proline/glycine betaine transport system substrate-binding protein